MRIFALEKLIENQLKSGGIYSPKEICPLAAGKGNFALPVDRTVDRDRSQSTDVHRRARPFELVGQSTGRSTVQRVLLFGNGPGRPTRSIDRQRALLSVSARSTRRSTGQRAVALWIQSRSTGRSTDRRNGQKFDRWPVDRPVDRKGNLALFSCQRADFQMGYKYPI